MTLALQWRMIYQGVSLFCVVNELKTERNDESERWLKSVDLETAPLTPCDSTVTERGAEIVVFIACKEHFKVPPIVTDLGFDLGKLTRQSDFHIQK